MTRNEEVAGTLPPMHMHPSNKSYHEQHDQDCHTAACHDELRSTPLGESLGTGGLTALA